MTHLDDSRHKPTLTGAKQNSKSLATKAKAPNQLYLRDVHDLTLHGGIDAGGNLVLLPVLSGLGTKGIKASDYLRQSLSLWEDGQVLRVMRGFGWTPSKQTLYNVKYPALTGSLPLPGVAVIDRVLGDGDTAVSWQAVTRMQLSRCAELPNWRVFKFFGEKLREPRDATVKLLAAEDQFPGLLTESFLQILQALQELYAAIDQAEAASRFVILDDRELRLAFQFSYHYRSLGAHFNDSTVWSTYFKDLLDRSMRIREALADPKRRVKVSDRNRLLRDLETINSTSWALFADVGSKDLMAFARTVESAQRQGPIRPEGAMVERDLDSTGTSWSEEAIRMARPRSFRLANALGLAWQQITAAAVQKDFYRGMNLQLPQLSRAWSLRFVPESAFATLLDQFPTRPIVEGGTLVVRTDASHDQSTSTSEAATQTTFRIEPAVVRPEVAATRAASRLKKFPALADRFLTLSSAGSSLGEPWSATVPSVFSDERQQLVWPHGRIWQAVDMVKTLAALPGLLLCPEVLANGYQCVSSEDFEQLGLKAGTLPVSGRLGPTWNKVYDWFLGVTPWPALPLATKKQTLFSDSIARPWPLTVVDGGIAVADVRLAVRLVQSGGEHAALNLASLTALIRDFSKTAADRGESLTTLNRYLEEFSDGLRFEARPYFEVDGQSIEESEWFGAVKTKAGYYRLPSGRVVDVAAYLAKTDQFILRKRVYAKFQNLRLSDIWRVQNQVLAESSASLPPEEYIKQLSLRIDPILKDLDGQALEPVKNNLLADSLRDLAPILRSYQADGLAWGYLRLHLGLGVCLADEMGLGKTLQAIALLRAMRDTNKPSLVVMPKTLLYNWRRELERYGQGLRVAVHGEGALDEKIAQADVWLVTYPRLRLDQKILTSQKWNVVILDEAQAIKNAGTQVTEAANQLDARYRLALTGTPVENRAAELWSIINWLNPGYLGEQVDFNAYTSIARSSEQKSVLLAPLRECLDPLILRRVKSDPRVALGLPEKIHLDLTCELSEEQAALYEAVLETILAEDALGLKAFARRAMFLKAILHLKQICIHPDLFYGEQDEDDVVAEIDATTTAATRKIRQLVLHRIRQRSKTSAFEGWLARSGKLSAVRELIDSLRFQSRGILIFTQYLGAADLLRRALANLQLGTIPFIHGGLSAEERLELVDEFNEVCRARHDNESCPILILSLKAGGTGLNLTGADRVIHFDRWWNPAVEDQATDRAHRIGQNRSVFTHTVTSQGTIEEAIGRIFIEKRRLAEDLLGAASTEDVGDLLRDRDGFLDLVDPQRIFSNRLVRPAPGSHTHLS